MMFNAEHEALKRRASHVAQYVSTRITDVDLQPHTEFAHDIVDKLQEEGLLSLGIPRAYGGVEADAVGFAIVQEELGSVDGGVANFIADQTISPIIIDRYGTAEQKDLFYKTLVDKRQLSFFAMTEPGAGSDVGGISTRAIKSDGNYILSGMKSWVTTGGVGKIGIVFAKTDPTRRSGGLSAFIVTKDMDGIHINKVYNKLGWRFHNTAELLFDNVVVPESLRLGSEGEGHLVFNRGLNYGRLGIGAQSLGVSEGALALCVERTKQRIQFGRPLAEFQLTRWKIGDMAAKIEALRSLVFRAATAINDEGEKNLNTLCCAVKALGSEIAMAITTEAVQLFGADGFHMSSPVARLMRDAKGLQIADGTTEIMRLIIAKEVLGGHLIE